MKTRYVFTVLLLLTLSLLPLASNLAYANAVPSLAGVKNLIHVPLTRQNTDYTCGITALQAILGYYQIDKRLDVLAAEIKPDAEYGTNYINMANYAASLGLKASVRTGMTIEELKKHIDQKEPVLLAIQAWADAKSSYNSYQNEDGHYVVAVGYDENNFYFMDPSTLGHYTYIPTAEFITRWHDYDSYGNKTLLRFGLILTKPQTALYNPEVITPLD